MVLTISTGILCIKNFENAGTDVSKDQIAHINVNGLRKVLYIANYIAKEFEHTCTPHDIKKREEFKLKYLSKKSDIIYSAEQLQISVQIVNDAVNKTESNK